jgi:hypothetical protein
VGFRTKDRERPWRWTVEIDLSTCGHGLMTLYFLKFAEELKFADEYRPHWWCRASGPTLLLSGEDDPARLAIDVIGQSWSEEPFGALERCPVDPCDSCPPLKDKLRLVLPVAELFRR